MERPNMQHLVVLRSSKKAVPNEAYIVQEKPFSGFNVLGEHTGSGHDRNLVVSFRGKPPCSEGPGHNRLPAVQFDGKTKHLWLRFFVNAAIIGMALCIRERLLTTLHRRMTWQEQCHVGKKVRALLAYR
ncbi:hypothetical protein M5K25_014424 [Dendrobium thyrsiflorum]|uniref:Uncharacterized protein n=1 Tax=Dendrobium thyrsiflorum TaxID=117978 RepID=A0ABD0UW61_DENTH